MSDTKHPSEDPAFATAHHVAFRSLPAPAELAVGDHVWVIDHYYPGRVARVEPSGKVVVTIPTWSHDAEGPERASDGSVKTTDLGYWPHHYHQLRVDPGCARFAPR